MKIDLLQDLPDEIGMGPDKIAHDASLSKLKRGSRPPKEANGPEPQALSKPVAAVRVAASPRADLWVRKNGGRETAESLRGVDLPVKVAIVHDWLTVYGGAERVLEQILSIAPQADVFTLVDFIPEQQRGFLGGRRPTTSFIQHLPFAKRKYRSYLPIMPYAIEQFDLSSYPLVISSSYAVAKGVLTGPDQLHISYVHSPARYAWDLSHQYLRQSGLTSGLKSVAARYLLHQLRTWDIRTANGVDTYVANSAFIARRIWKCYRREATVVYPPVDVSRFPLREQKEDFYLTASRLVPYKRVDLIVAAFRKMPDRRLVVVGDGPDYHRIKAEAPRNVEIVGFQPHSALVNYMQRARAFIIAAEEDFGIVPLEAQACGTPVIAFGKGGILETVTGLDSSRPTGTFFPIQSVDSLAAAVSDFESHRDAFVPQWCRELAMKFSIESFRSNFGRLLERELNAAAKRGFLKANCGQAGPLAGETRASRAMGDGR